MELVTPIGESSLSTTEAGAPRGEPAWACPECLGPLAEEAAALRCPQCGALHPLLDGIPSFARQRDFYYGEVGRLEARWLLEQVASRGYEAGVRAFLGSLQPAKAEDLRYYLLDGRRTAWRLLVGRTTRVHALDLGCGWGTLAFGLAEAFATVTAMDLTMERLRFARARARAEGRENLRFVCGGDAPHLPFPAGSFDLVVLNGVLEWVPTGKPGDPRRLQEEFLREVARVLTPAGQMYLAIENRLSYRYLLGWPEDHTGLRFGALLPRPLANVYSRLVRGRPYRTYTYTTRGYRSLLDAAGFSAVARHVPVPDYREIDEIRLAVGENGSPPPPDGAGPAWGAGGLRRSVKRVLERAFPAAFSFVASRGGAMPTVLEETCSRIARRIGPENGQPGAPWRVVSPLRVGSAGAAAFQLALGGEAARCTVKVPLDRLGAVALEGNADSLADLDDDRRLPEAVRGVLPRFLARVEGPGCTAFVETTCPGSGGLAWLERGRGVAPVAEEALRLLAALHGATARPVRVEEEMLGAWLAPFERRLRLQAEGAPLVAGWGQIVRRLQADLVGVELPLVRTHGDFWIGNLLVEGARGGIRGVIDWAASAAEGLPLLDAIHFLLCLEKAKTGMRRPMAEIIDEKLVGGLLSAFEADLLAGYARSLGLDPALDRVFRPFVWMDHCLRYWDRLGINGHWYRHNVGRFLESEGESGRGRH